MSLPAIKRLPGIQSEPSELELLRNEIDWRLLETHGWDRKTLRFEPEKDDTYFGYETCDVPECKFASYKAGLCTACHRRFDKVGGTRNAFLRIPRPPIDLMNDGPELCLVCRTPGHERPSSGPSGLCSNCESKRKWRDQCVEDFVKGDESWAPATPLASHGRCARRGCTRWAAIGSTRLCVRCQEDRRAAGNPDLSKWRSSTPIMNFGGGRFADLSPLRERVRLELLLGIQASAMDEVHLSCNTIQQLSGRAFRSNVDSLLEFSMERGKSRDRLFLSRTQQAVRLVFVDPDEELERDVWDLMMLGFPSGGGRRRRLDFTPISQGWLREAAKQWAKENIARSVGRTGEVLGSVRRLSAHLRKRPDKGEVVSVLARTDIAALLRQLSRLESAGKLSPDSRRSIVYDVRFFLRSSRELGLANEAGPLGGLADSFSILREDIPVAWRAQDTGSDKSLPQIVMDQLLGERSQSELLEVEGAEVRDLILLQIWNGRRPGETCSLELDCLEYSSSGEPVLLYDAGKQKLRRIRVPIHHEPAEIIERQAKRITERFPDTPRSELSLFPARSRNPRGIRSIPVTHLANRIRNWVDRLEIKGQSGSDFPKDRINAYAFRHTYAQRHADHGTPVDVLSALLAHENLTSTQHYYHVPEKRKRMATALVSPMTLNNEGDVVGGDDVLDAVLARREIGRIPVPLGWCTEKSNVAAHGSSCPYRYQCLGCSHFRTDPSHLEDLQNHLQRLLAADEELDAKLPGLADWARDDALPSQGEIKAVRELVRANKRLLSELPAQDRAAVEEAIATMRKLRAQADMNIPDADALKVKIVSPTINPAVETID